MTDADVTTGGPALARWRRTVTAAFGLGGITISAWGPRLPAIKADLGIGTATIGLLLAGVTAHSARRRPPPNRPAPPPVIGDAAASVV